MSVLESHAGVLIFQKLSTLPVQGEREGEEVRGCGGGCRPDGGHCPLVHSSLRHRVRDASNPIRVNRTPLEKRTRPGNRISTTVRTRPGNRISATAMTPSVNRISTTVRTPPVNRTCTLLDPPRMTGAAGGGKLGPTRTAFDFLYEQLYSDTASDRRHHSDVGPGGPSRGCSSHLLARSPTDTSSTNGCGQLRRDREFQERHLPLCGPCCCACPCRAGVAACGAGGVGGMYSAATATRGSVQRQRVAVEEFSPTSRRGHDADGQAELGLPLGFFKIFLAKETHQIAEANQEKNAKLKEAFGLTDYVEGSAFDPDRKAKEEAAKAAALAQKKYSMVQSSDEDEAKAESSPPQKKKKKKSRHDSSSPERSKEKRKKSRKHSKRDRLANSSHSKKQRKRKHRSKKRSEEKRRSKRQHNSSSSDSDSQDDSDDSDVPARSSSDKEGEISRTNGHFNSSQPTDKKESLSPTTTSAWIRSQSNKSVISSDSVAVSAVSDSVWPSQETTAPSSAVVSSAVNGGARRSHSRSLSRSRSRTGSHRSRSYKRSSHRSRSDSSRSRSRSHSRSRSRTHSPSRSPRRSRRSRSHSRSHSRSRSLSSASDRRGGGGSGHRDSRSPSIRRRHGSPSHLDKRRITSARKRPVPYYRPSPSPSDSDSSYASRSRTRSPASRSRFRSLSRSPSLDVHHRRRKQQQQQQLPPQQQQQQQQQQYRHHHPDQPLHGTSNPISLGYMAPVPTSQLPPPSLIPTS
ncbi:serine/arginine repetitive matrix protein 4 isoform X2 [Aplysia californica]|uniref:Serine/arginine repetitive matrix protein 4 isoform X2 n=1 Tax=Aplysia californica TaxID=6500 RepID=A0ABM1VWB5_APLCA|nr:serine/arginine repetitive matrix protein 4 isoform X2 [Aplysia californica]